MDNDYLVFRRQDMKKYLSTTQLVQLMVAQARINEALAKNNEPSPKFLVVEQSFPTYAQLVEQVATQVNQQTCQHKWTWYPVAGEGKICSHCHKRDYNVED